MSAGGTHSERLRAATVLTLDRPTHLIGPRALASSTGEAKWRCDGDA